MLSALVLIYIILKLISPKIRKKYLKHYLIKKILCLKLEKNIIFI